MGFRVSGFRGLGFRDSRWRRGGGTRLAAALALAAAARCLLSGLVLRRDSEEVLSDCPVSASLLSGSSQCRHCNRPESEILNL